MRARRFPLLAALAFAAACAGCAAIGGPAPRLGPDASGFSSPAIEGARERALALSVWPAERPERAALLALHGYGDHAESTFAEAARFWAAAGVSVYAYDHRGFGRDPERGAWPGAETLVADVAAVARRLRAEAPERPLFLLGHSMGGGAALAAMGLDPPPPVDGLILAAPAIAGGSEVNPLARALAWGTAALAPDKRWTGRGVVRIQASDDIAMLRRLAADPLYIGAPSARELVGLVRVMDAAAEAAPKVEVPVLLLTGARDEVVDPDRAERVGLRAAGPVEAIRYQEGWHMLFRDLQKERVWRDVRDWVLARAADEASAAGEADRPGARGGARDRAIATGGGAGRKGNAAAAGRRIAPASRRRAPGGPPVSPMADRRATRPARSAIGWRSAMHAARGRDGRGEAEPGDVRRGAATAQVGRAAARADAGPGGADG